MAGELHGWHPDPFGVHEQRYFSQGKPTKLVKDGATESYDAPPVGVREDIDVPADPVPEFLVAPLPSEQPADLPIAGWYADSADPHSLRWWDGKCWTDHTRQRHGRLGHQRATAGSGSELLERQLLERQLLVNSEESYPARLPLHKQWWLWTVTAIVVLAGIVALVEKGSKSPGDAVRRRDSTTTVAPSTTTTVAIPVAPQPSPEDAASALISGWATQNKPRALSVATSQAVATLFASPYPNGLAISRGCSDGASPIVCTYGPPGGSSPNDSIYSLSLVQAPGGGWYVSSVQINA